MKALNSVWGYVSKPINQEPALVNDVLAIVIDNFTKIDKPLIDTIAGSRTADQKKYHSGLAKLRRVNKFFKKQIDEIPFFKVQTTVKLFRDSILEQVKPLLDLKPIRESLRRGYAIGYHAESYESGEKFEINLPGNIFKMSVHIKRGDSIRLNPMPAYTTDIEAIYRAMTARATYWYVTGAELSSHSSIRDKSLENQSLTIAQEVAQKEIAKIIKDKESYAKKPFWFSSEPWKQLK